MSGVRASHVLEAKLHVVAQVVEAELVVGAIGDIGGVGVAPLIVVDAMDDAADGEAEEAVDLPHPFAVALGQVVVNGDDVDALAGQRVEIDGQRRDQRLAFAGLHLGDHAAMEDDAAEQLDVEMALAEDALRRFAHRCEGVDQDIVERLPGGDACLQRAGAGAQLVVRHRGERRLRRVDGVDQGLQAFDEPIVGRAEESPGDGADHRDLNVANGNRSPLLNDECGDCVTDRDIAPDCQFLGDFSWGISPGPAGDRTTSCPERVL